MDSKKLFGLFFLVLLSASLFMISQVGAVVDDGGVPCNALDPCPDGYHCNVGICVANTGPVDCTDDLDCNDWEFCSGGICYNKAGLNKGCTTDHECLSGVCSPFFRCVECDAYNPCERGTCDYDTYSCIECSDDDDCPDNYCSEDNVCTCYYGETCGGDICLDNTKEPLSAFYVCRQLTEGKCSQLDFCSYTNDVCSYNYLDSDYVDLSHYVDLSYIYNNYAIGSIFYETSCVECTDNDLSNCNEGDVCSDNNLCIECESNSDCSDTPGTPFCDISTNKCVECLTDYSCQDEFCTFITDNCLNGETCGTQVCRDNKNDFVNWYEYCNSYGKDSSGCTNTEFPILKLCNFDSTQKQCVINKLWIGEAYMGGELTDIQITDDSTNVYFKVEDLYDAGIVEDFYIQYCISQNECDYFCSSSNTCDSNACGAECLDNYFCDSSSGDCTPYLDFFDICSYDRECGEFTGYCGPFDYCTQACEVDSGNAISEECGTDAFCHDFGGDIILCVECLDYTDCPDEEACLNGRCDVQRTDGDGASFDDSTYLGSRIVQTVYTLSGYVFSDLINFLDASFGVVFESSKSKDKVFVNVTLPLSNKFYLDDVLFLDTTTADSVRFEKGSSYQNVFFNYTGAFKFILSGYYEVENFVAKLTCSENSAEFGFTSGTTDYSCVCGKDHFCEEGLPCSCIESPLETRFYSPFEYMDFTADTRKGLSPSGSDYIWYWEKENSTGEIEFLKLGETPVFYEAFPYPFIYDVNLTVSKSGEKDSQLKSIMVADEVPYCHLDPETGKASWLYSVCNGNPDCWFYEEVGSLAGEWSYSNGSFYETCDKKGTCTYPAETYVSCDYSDFGDSSNCCPIGQTCKNNICVDSNQSIQQCSDYLDEDSCINDIENVRWNNGALPEDAQGCYSPYYNESTGKWYNTDCSCVWTDGACYSSYDLSEDSESIGNCTSRKIIVAGDCSEGDAEYVYNLEAVWDGQGNQPATCKDQVGIKESCNSDIIKLPSFTWLDFIIAILIITLIYSLFSLKRKTKNRVKKT